MANYRTAEIFFLKDSLNSYKFFCGIFFCQKFVCLHFFCPFLPLDGQKRAKKHPQVNKIVILGMKGCSSLSQIFCTGQIYTSPFFHKKDFEVGNFKKIIFSKNQVVNLGNFWSQKFNLWVLVIFVENRQTTENIFLQL